MIAISLRRPVTILMIVCGVLVLGVISYMDLGRDLLPDIAFPSLTVMTKYEGAAPQEVEEYITKRLEASLATVKGKRRITSVSREGMSLITIEFEWGHDMQFAILHVREKLDIARFQSGFPKDAERPNILRWDPSSKPIVGLAITGKGSILDVKEGVREVIKPRLEQLKGVAMAQISGDIERVIDVEVNLEKLALYKITLREMSAAIGTANDNIPGGTIRKGRYRYTLRTLGEFLNVHEINDVVVSRKGGRDIRVSDVAVVRDTTKDRDSMATINGQEAIGLLVYKEAGANTIEATKLVKDLLKELNQPGADFQVTLAFEQAQFIEQALNNVWSSLLFGGVFAFLVLVLFLEDLKSPFFIFTSIPIAIVSTLVAMDFFGLSLNLMSLGGLALGVGMLVDNSIVVLENIYRHRAEGLSPMEAAFKGTQEVAMPVAASTFTTLAVFFPIVYLEGIAGALFGEQAETVTYSLLSSLIVSLTVLPLLTTMSSILEGRDSLPSRLTSMPVMEAHKYPRHLAFWKPWEYIIAALVTVFVAAYFKLEWKYIGYIVVAIGILPVVMYLLKWFFTLLLSWTFQAVAMCFVLVGYVTKLFLDKAILPAFNFCYSLFEKVYHHVLVWALDNKLATISLALGALTISGLVFKDLKREVMPKSATGQFSISLKLEAGTSLESTSLVVESFEKLLKGQESVDIVFSQLGASEANLAQLLQDSGTNTAEMSVKLKKDFISMAEVYRLTEMVREKVSEYPGMELTFKESESAFEDLLSVEGGSGLIVELTGEHFEDMFIANKMVMDTLEAFPGLKDVRTSMTQDYPQIRVELNRDKIAYYGFGLTEIGEFLAGGMRGDVATLFKEFDRQIDVRVRFSEVDRENFEKVLTMVLISPNGTPVPVGELIKVEPVKGMKEVRRVNQRRVALVSADLAGKKISEVVPALAKELDQLVMPKGVSVPRIAGEQEGFQKSFRSLIFAFTLSILLVYMIMAAQFESLRDPFVVILTVPMGLIGTAFMLYTFNQTINIMSMIGLVVLCGIVVNDAIVKVDFFNEARAKGMTLRDAIFEGSRVRLRPILMTTATTVLGLWPMASTIVWDFINLPLIRNLVQIVDVRLIALQLTPLTDLFSPRGAEIQKPLAMVLIGGLSVATMLTLILIPVLYELFSAKEKPVEVVSETTSTLEEASV